MDVGTFSDSPTSNVFFIFLFMETITQESMFKSSVEFIYLPSVIWSGYENDVAKLAIEDKVAYRAARKNMQIHSAIICKIDWEFSGFMTFQVNHNAKEFCLLQSAMIPEKKDKEIYKDMVKEIIKQNTYGYPMFMTVSTKHDLENPKVFEGCGFVKYLTTGTEEFAYMIYGTPEQCRMKRLCHATMTNIWYSYKWDWLKMKKEWNEKIENAGIEFWVENPKFASREGCWQGSAGFSSVVTSKNKVEDDGEVVHKDGKALNGNASVLDPVVCETALRFFMPKGGKRVYNPFGGGVQMWFVAGDYGYEYESSEIRQNQCDANNKICTGMKAVWTKSDTAKYIPEEKSDLTFSCPPYYKVEKYIDYDGKSPDWELNSIDTYEGFREMLFEGYKNAISVMKDNTFFVVMTWDSRDKNGAYFGCEAEHELFFKSQGLQIYNRITYLESEFTRRAQAKMTLDSRKFPKAEQKILVFYKWDITKIKELYPSVWRL